MIRRRRGGRESDEIAMKGTKKCPRITTAVDVYIGARMRDRRLAIGLTQQDLAKTLGVSFQQVQKYEIGLNRVSAARLFEICDVLDVSIASMFERKLRGS
jgi:DNA-binding XRE family transcriptional regulator